MYSTAQVAERLGVNKRTLLRWLASGRVREPKRQTGGGQEVRIWTDKDLKAVQKFKEANYRKGRGRKKKTK